MTSYLPHATREHKHKLPYTYLQRSISIQHSQLPLPRDKGDDNWLQRTSLCCLFTHFRIGRWRQHESLQKGLQWLDGCGLLKVFWEYYVGIGVYIAVFCGVRGGLDTLVFWKSIPASLQASSKSQNVDLNQKHADIGLRSK